VLTFYNMCRIKCRPGLDRQRYRSELGAAGAPAPAANPRDRDRACLIARDLLSTVGIPST